MQILCPPGSERAQALADRLRAEGGKIAAYPDAASSRRVLVPIARVLRAESGPRGTLLHCDDGAALESPVSLRELETTLASHEFLRVSRWDVVNFAKVRAISPAANARLPLELEGGATVLATRSYVGGIKRKLQSIA